MAVPGTEGPVAVPDEVVGQRAGEGDARGQHIAGSEGGGEGEDDDADDVPEHADRAVAADLPPVVRGDAHYWLRRSPRMLSKNDEKKTWMPMIISDAARTARRSSESSPKPRLAHVMTMAAEMASPARPIAPPSSSPCSSLKRARMRSNHGSFSPMKYVP